MAVGALSPRQVFGFAELGRVAAVQGALGALQVRREALETLERLPLEIKAQELANQNAEFGITHLNPLRLSGLEIENKLRQQEVVLNEQKARVARLEADRGQRFQESALDGWEGLFEIQPPLSAPQMNMERAEEYWNQYGAFLTGSDDPLYRSMGERLRTSLGKPATNTLAGVVQQAVERRDTAGLQQLRSAVMFDTTLSAEDKKLMRDEIDRHLQMLGVMPVEAPDAGLTPSAAMRERQRVTGLQGELTAKRVARNAAAARVRDLTELAVDDKDQAKALAEAKDALVRAESEIAGIEVQLGLREPELTPLDIDRLRAVLPDSAKKWEAFRRGDAQEIRRQVVEHLAKIEREKREAEDRLVRSGGKDETARKKADELAVDIMEIREVLRLQGADTQRSGMLLPPKDRGAPTSDYYEGLLGSPFVSPDSIE